MNTLPASQEQLKYELQLTKSSTEDVPLQIPPLMLASKYKHTSTHSSSETDAQ